MIPINSTAVVVAALVAFVIGFLMHGPVAGKLWMRLANIHPTGKEKFSDMYGKMFWNLIVNVVTAYGLAVFILLASSSPYVPGSSVAGGLICAFIVWLSFLVASSSIDVIWMGRSSSLWLFECFSSFLVMLSMGAIIALMH